MRISREVVKELIDKMFEIAGHDVRYEDLTNQDDQWYLKWSMTHEQQEEWIKWGSTYLAKQLRIPRYMAEREMDMFNFNYGLTLNPRVLAKN